MVLECGACCGLGGELNFWAVVEEDVSLCFVVGSDGECVFSGRLSGLDGHVLEHPVLIDPCEWACALLDAGLVDESCARCDKLMAPRVWGFGEQDDARGAISECDRRGPRPNALVELKFDWKKRGG